MSHATDQSGGFVLAVDVGGTCTDCVVFREGDPIRFGKALSTPPQFARGVLESVRVTANDMGLTLEQLLGQTRLFLHGSTVVDNTIFTREGARTGLITTAGFEDTLLVTRGAYGRWSGQPEEAIKHPVASNRSSWRTSRPPLGNSSVASAWRPLRFVCSGRFAIRPMSDKSAISSAGWRRTFT